MLVSARLLDAFEVVLGADEVESPKPAPETHDRLPPPEAQRWAVAIDLVGAQHPLWPEGDDQTPTIVSHFKGPQEQWKVPLSTPRRWCTATSDRASTSSTRSRPGSWLGELLASASAPRRNHTL
jgi:hypothetical protein